MPQPACLTLALYRSTLRSCRRVRSVMRPGHCFMVAEVVKKFAMASGSPALLKAVEDHGPIPLDSLVSRAFRMPAPPHEEAALLDAGFGAIRAINSMEQHFIGVNKMFDSLEGLSDREAPGEASTSMIVREIMRDSNMRITRA